MTALARGSLFLARIQQARGKAAEALENIQQLEKQVLRQSLPRFLPYLGAIRAMLFLAEDEVEQAARWAQKAHLHVDDELNHLYEFPYVILAQVLARTGRSDDAALLLTRLLTHAETEGRMRSVIDILVCQAVVFHWQGRDVQAQQSLLRALSLAEPEGWLRVFIDQGTPMRTLLSSMLAEQTNTLSTFPQVRSFVKILLTIIEQGRSAPFSLQPSVSPRLNTPFPVSLTAREREVLHLTALGLSTQHIARELVIAVSTVKWHLKQISTKLAVHSRIQMIARARELHLL